MGLGFKSLTGNKSMKFTAQIVDYNKQPCKAHLKIANKVILDFLTTKAVTR